MDNTETNRTRIDHSNGDEYLKNLKSKYHKFEMEMGVYNHELFDLAVQIKSNEFSSDMFDIENREIFYKKFDQLWVLGCNLIDCAKSLDKLLQTEDSKIFLSKSKKNLTDSEQNHLKAVIADEIYYGAGFIEEFYTAH